MVTLKWKRSDGRPRLYVSKGPVVTYDVWPEPDEYRKGIWWRAVPSIRTEEPGWNYHDRGLVSRRFRRLADAKLACRDHAFFDELSIRA